jgi:hypothetical protein
VVGENIEIFERDGRFSAEKIAEEFENRTGKFLKV